MRKNRLAICIIQIKSSKIKNTWKVTQVNLCSTFVSQPYITDTPKTSTQSPLAANAISLVIECKISNQKDYQVQNTAQANH